MRTRTILTALVLSAAILAAMVGTSAAAGCGRGPCGGGAGPCGAGMGPGMAAKPLFTAEQQEQVEKIRAKFEEQRVDLHNKMAALRLEIREMVRADEPDFSKIESKIDEVSTIRTKLAKMRLQQHKEVRALLTPEQKKLFDAGFDGGCCGRGGMGAGCAMGAPKAGGAGCGMACGKMAGGGMPGCSMGGGKGGGMPGCTMGSGTPGCGMQGAAMGAGVCPMGGAGQPGHPGCPMMGAAGGAMQGTKQQSEPWRRWL